MLAAFACLVAGLPAYLPDPALTPLPAYHLYHNLLSCLPGPALTPPPAPAYHIYLHLPACLPGPTLGSPTCPCLSSVTSCTSFATIPGPPLRRSLPTWRPSCSAQNFWTHLLTSHDVHFHAACAPYLPSIKGMSGCTCLPRCIRSVSLRPSIRLPPPSICIQALVILLSFAPHRVCCRQTCACPESIVDPYE